MTRANISKDFPHVQAPDTPDDLNWVLLDRFGIGGFSALLTVGLVLFTIGLLYLIP